MKYKAVGFDYGGVIQGEPRSIFHSKVAELFGVTVQEFLDAYYLHNKKVNRNEITRPELWRLVAAELKQPEKAEEAAQLSYLVLDAPVNEQMLDLVDQIKSKGYKVGLLTNNTPDADEKMQGFDVPAHFDVVHNSAVTQLVKPEPAAFEYFANELGISLSKLIFIDDVEKSLSTAKECGYTPVLFESYEKLIKDLLALGLSSS